jgi:hypothetical protein
MKKVTEKIIASPDLSVLKEEHVNKWVALSPDYKKFLAVGESLSAVLLKVKSSSEKVVIKVLPNLGYAPAVI